MTLSDSHKVLLLLFILTKNLGQKGQQNCLGGQQNCLGVNKIVWGQQNSLGVQQNIFGGQQNSLGGQQNSLGSQQNIWGVNKIVCIGNCGQESLPKNKFEAFKYRLL